MRENDSVYRKTALDRLSSPDQLDLLMQIISPRGWLTLVGIGLLMVAGLVWSLVGTVPIEISGEGVLMRQGGVATLAAGIDGQVDAVHVRLGDVVDSGAELALVHERLPSPAKTPPSGTEAGTRARADAPVTVANRLLAPFPARVLEVLVSRGDSVAASAPLLTLEPIEEELIAVLFLPTSAISRLRSGQPVRVVPRFAGEMEQGALSGRVKRVVPLPATTRMIERVIGDDALAERLARGGSTIQVEVELASPPLVASSGVRTHGRIRVGEKRPIVLVLPWIRKWLAT